MILNQPHLIDFISLGNLSHDKKLALLFVVNLIVIYIIDHAIFTYVGIG